MLKTFTATLLFSSSLSLLSNSWSEMLAAKKGLIIQHNCQQILMQYESFCSGNAPAIVDARVKGIPIVECDEEVVDITVLNHPRIYMMPQPSKPFESPNHCAGFSCSSKMRLSLFKKLQEVILHIDTLAAEFGYLPGKIDVVVFEGLRSVAVQEGLFQNKRREIKLINPALSDRELDAETAKWVSPTKNNVPVHSTGAAVDIRLVIQGEYIDMGKFGVIWGPNEAVPTFSEIASDIQKNNRLFLLMAATKAGLVNYVYEFWHFSYGDRYEAFWKQKDTAQYGSV